MSTCLTASAACCTGVNPERLKEAYVAHQVEQIAHFAHQRVAREKLSHGVLGPGFTSVTSAEVEATSLADTTRPLPLLRVWQIKKKLCSSSFFFFHF